MYKMARSKNICDDTIEMFCLYKGVDFYEIHILLRNYKKKLSSIKIN